MTVKLYMSSVSSNLETKKQIQKIQLMLDGLGIQYDNVDLGTPCGCTDTRGAAAREKERERETMR